MYCNYTGGVMLSMLTSSAVNRGFVPWSGQTKDYKIGICCIFFMHIAVRNESKDWTAGNQNDMSEQLVYLWTVVSVS